MFNRTKVVKVFKQTQRKTKSGNTATGTMKIASQGSVFVKVAKGYIENYEK